ncbi:MAG: aryl-sulfate sulfotransferase [Planctomycetes bacterium]|nr:aryl-sulfate sulfotransferase [Planctomycetota bacterium]MCB9868592.1 aryl-sulfate sulfotransferase [Planctomycetota bacterium]
MAASPRPFLLTTLASALLSTLTLAQSATYVHSDGTTHHYLAVATPSGVTWTEANAAAAQAGGYLATVESDTENQILYSLVAQPSFWTQSGSTWLGPWLGGLQGAVAQEPAGDWGWAQLDRFAFTAWTAGYPNNTNGADRIHFGGGNQAGATWADAPSSAKMLGYVVEFSGATVPVTVGLQRDDAGSNPGYTLFAPWNSTSTYLIDLRGRRVNTWNSTFTPGMVCYLLPGGDMVRCGYTANPAFPAGGQGGVVEVFDWNGKLKNWYRHSDATACLHHDIQQLPNGNFLMIAWELKTGAEAIAAGRDPASMADGELWPEKIIEVQLDPAGGGKIVWEWHVWDHLVQDFDATKPNYGSVGGHPELIDLNYTPDRSRDWQHANAVHYNAALDQIVLSARAFSEIWIIDHGTTTAEASGHTGGKQGKGGDLLFRWGNPAAWRAGTAANRRLFVQHDAHWIPAGLRGAGNMMVFNNGTGRAVPHSTVDEIDLQPSTTGSYGAASTWEQRAIVWTYQAPNPADFYSPFVSSGQRLPNGNTLICAGWNAHMFEVDVNNKIVWEYTNADLAVGPLHQGTIPGSNVVFRSPRYLATGPELTGKTLTAGVPVEQHDSVLLVAGSTLRYRAALGETVTFDLRAKHSPNSVYIVASSITEGLLPIDFRYIRLGDDPVLYASLSLSAPTVFQNYFNRLDATGRAVARVTLPNVPAASGLSLYTGMVVTDLAAPNSIGLISNTVKIEVQ